MLVTRPRHPRTSIHASLRFQDRMYTVGSLFYAIYFFVSFPMFYRIDEDTK